jgi:plasmid stabilization system protein ParE
VIRRVIFSPEAEADLAEAYDWYEARDKGLGSELVRCVESCAGGIRRHPEMYPVIHRNVRQGITRRFPYSLLYFVEDEAVYIVAVFHAARDPGIWKARV